MKQEAHDKMWLYIEVNAKNYYEEEYETVAMGDSENDLPMLEYADISVAMGNGVKEVKEKADYVTDKIDNDGLYKAFKHLKLF